jgi:hypothetical protein
VCPVSTREGSPRGCQRAADRGQAPKLGRLGETSKKSLEPVLNLFWRLLVPVTPGQGAGAMLLVTRTSPGAFDARFVCRAMFIPCAGARDEETAKRLTEAFKREDFKDVKSLRRHTPPDESCWCAGPGWWLSTAGNP